MEVFKCWGPNLSGSKFVGDHWLLVVIQCLWLNIFWGQNFCWVQNCLGLSIFGVIKFHLNLGVIHILGKTIFSVSTIEDHSFLVVIQFWGTLIFEEQICFGSTIVGGTFLGGSFIFGCHSILGVIQFWGPLILVLQIYSVAKKKSGSKIVGVNKSWGSFIFGIHSIFRANNFLWSTTFWGSKFVPLKKFGDH